MRLAFTSLWLSVDIRLGRDEADTTALEERGPGATSADLTVSTSNAAEGYYYEDNTIGFTSSHQSRVTSV